MAARDSKVPGKRGRLIVGWRQVAVTKARVRPVRAAPPVAAADPAPRLPDPLLEKDEDSE